MQAELENLTAALETPERPVAVVVGGAKVSTKLDLLGNLLDKADAVMIGGGMANTFLKAQGHEVGKSLVEADALPEAERLLAKAGERLVLPTDVVVAAAFAADRFSARAHKVNRGKSIFQIVRHANGERRLTVIDADIGDDAGL